MKLLGILLLMLLPLSLFAQHLTGTVIDRSDELPVVFANVTALSQVTVTSYSGEFALNNLTPGDTIKITCIGYKPYKRVYRKTKSDTVIIYLQQSSILLKDVNVKARHNFKQDSINMRRQFSAIFNYKAPGLKDMFTTIDPNIYIPYNYIDAPNNATSILSVNLLSVFSLLSKNKAPESKLQKTLIQDEENTYVDRSFSKQKITAITNLKGDSLLNFMDTYRPTIAEAKKMTDYEMVVYIKNSYAQFIETYKREEKSPFSHEQDNTEVHLTK
jgi:hypothetical protein